MSKDPVTRKIIVVRTVYFYYSGFIFATKNFVTESVFKVRSFIRIFLQHLIGEKCGLENGVYPFWVKMKKHREISTYFCLKHHCGKEVIHFSVQCILAKTMLLPTLDLHSLI